MKLSQKTQVVYDRILAGEIPTQHVVTGSLVRGIHEGAEPVRFPNGDKIHNSIVRSLLDGGLIVRKLTHSFGTWGYMDKDFAFYPAGQVPDTEPKKEYAL